MRHSQSVRRGLANQRRRFLEEKPRWTGILTPRRRCTPKRILTARPADQIAYFVWYRRAAGVAFRVFHVQKLRNAVAVRCQAITVSMTQCDVLKLWRGTRFQNSLSCAGAHPWRMKTGILGGLRVLAVHLHTLTPKTPRPQRTRRRQSIFDADETAASWHPTAVPFKDSADELQPLYSQAVRFDICESHSGKLHS
jgi:hypothetical protein